MSNANILCTICARAGSKGVQNKNSKLLHGKPLIAYSIEQALAANLFEHVVVSTDSEEIADIAVEYGGEVFFKRKQELASDHAGKLAVIRDAFMRSEQHFAQEFDTLIDLDATSPLRTVKDIVQAYQQFKQHNHDNLITAMPSRRSPYFNMVELDDARKVSLAKKLQESVVRRQDAPKTYDMNASIYIWKRSKILKQDKLFLENTGLYVMPEERSIDIDSELDFKFVEYIMGEKNAKG